VSTVLLNRVREVEASFRLREVFDRLKTGLGPLFCELLVTTVQDSAFCRASEPRH
jgi:hypothetical protein